MGGQLPKDPAARRRRNRRGATVLPVAGRDGKAPSLGRRPGGGSWLKATREWWKVIWASPMATVWIDTDTHTLRRLAWIVDKTHRGEATAASTREARLLEDAFGLSPYGRRRLEWSIEEAEVVELRSRDPAHGRRRRRLRATEPAGAVSVSDR